MISRSLLISSAVKLSLRNSQLIITYLDGDAAPRQVPIEDIGYVVLEHQQSVASMPALNALSDNNVAVVFCDRDHLPSSMLLNLDSHSTQSENFRDQISAGLPLKKNLWQQIIAAKIKNQSLVLSKFGKDGDLLRPFYMNVKSGDSDNREGLAARLYWRELFGRDFIRDQDGTEINALLNYGYAILRAAVARALMGAGLLPTLGIFHRNRYNAFPLADDVMEPFRPFVDEIVYGQVVAGTCSLTKESKAELIRVVYADTRYGKLTRPLDIGLTFTCASLSRGYAKEQKQLDLPIMPAK
jgi:CRISPR-associated protein Cas1